MAKILLPILILLVTIAAGAQEDAPVCPTIKISEPDQRDIFFSHAELAVELSGGFQPTGYEWTISRGVVTEGTGTERIKIAFSRDDDGARFDAEVKVRGLPEGCEERAKINFNVDLNPGTLDMLDEFGELPDDDLRLRLDAAAVRLKDHPEFVLYFIIHNEPGQREKQFEKLKDKIQNHLSKDPLYDPQKIKILRSGENRLSVQIYLWPKGKAPPVISSNCPNFSITGSPIFVEPDEPIVFTANIDGELPKSAKLVWSVNFGQIVEGQGTERIVMTVDKETLMSYTIAATLEIKGLPEECPNTAAESLSPYETVDPILIDEFPGENVTEIARERLAVAIGEGVNNPTNQLYIIEYFPPWTSEFDIREKIERIRRYITDELKFDLNFVTIVTAEGKALNTKIYRVPPGAENPAP